MKKSRLSFLRRPLFWLALIVFGALAAGGAYFYFNQQQTRAQTTVVVSRGDLKATVNANGRVRAVKSVRLAFPLSGLITNIRVQEGDAVQANAVLAELDKREFERRVKQAEMNVQAREQDLREAQQPPPAQELEIAQQSLKKAALALAAAQDRYKQDATDDNKIAQDIAQSDYDIARANFERQTRGPTPKQLDALQRAIDSATIDLQNARDALAETELHAPFDGVVTEVNGAVGQLLGGYSPVVGLADLTRLEILADIDEIDVAQVQEGQMVELRFDAFPGESATGKLTRLFPVANTDRGATVYRAVVALDPTELKLRPGMGATVNIATLVKKNVLRVPSRAIKSAGAQKIVVVQEGNQTRNVVVETGVSDGNQTEIISGVIEGTVVIVE
ncbi:MAG: efflux RND transporter periplasmic adaptor subunit [Chloroflexi bacterium]|nr:efflux RND transporter periplasmic adaptor subunit [Chloroflexota bacterium]